MIPFLLSEYRGGGLPLSKIIAQYKVEDFEAAIADMKSGRTIKPVLLWS